MKKKKNVQESWIKPLREQLLKVKPLPSFAKSKDGIRIGERAVGEIVSGVRFCRERGLKISVTLNRRFNITDGCKCLLALNNSSRSYGLALGIFGINNAQAMKFGFCEDFVVHLYLIRNAMETWGMLYNRLWPCTGRFFKAHPEFGVK